MKFYHGSRYVLPVGLILDRRNLKNVGDYVIERVFEHYRPKGMISRLNGIFMVDDPSKVDIAGGWPDHIYLVQPLGPVSRHDWNCIDGIHSGLSNYKLEVGYKIKSEILWKRIFANKMVKSAAECYWQGKWNSFDDYEHPWEYLTDRAIVLKKLPKSQCKQYDRWANREPVREEA